MADFDSAPAKTEFRDGGPPVRPPELPEEAVLLRIFLGEDDRHRHLALYEAIVLKAREKHLAGATVLRGPLGFGKSSSPACGKNASSLQRPAHSDRNSRYAGKVLGLSSGAGRDDERGFGHVGTCPSDSAQARAPETLGCIAHPPRRK
jgi:Uncharacterized ACR, COG1993